MRGLTDIQLMNVAAERCGRSKFGPDKTREVAAYLAKDIGVGGFVERLETAAEVPAKTRKANLLSKIGPLCIAFLLLVVSGCISGIDSGAKPNPNDNRPTPIVTPSTGTLDAAIRAAMDKQRLSIQTVCASIEQQASAGTGDIESRGKQFNTECERIATETAKDVSAAVQAFRATPGFTEPEMWRQLKSGYGR